MSTTDPSGAEPTAQPNNVAPAPGTPASGAPAPADPQSQPAAATESDPARALPHYPAPLTGQIPAAQPAYPAAPGTESYPHPGYAQPAPDAAGYAQPGYAGYDPAAKSRLTAGLLGIFLGSIGVHRFYLGYIGIGLLQIAATIITFGAAAIWGLIEGIMILARARAFATDAEGRPLRE